MKGEATAPPGLTTRECHMKGNHAIVFGQNSPLARTTVISAALVGSSQTEIRVY